MNTAHLLKLTAIFFSLFHLYTGGAGAFPNIIQRAVHVCFSLVLCFAIHAADRKSKGRSRVPVYDFFLIALAIVTCSYVIIHYNRIVDLDFLANKTDLIMGAILSLLVLEAARRVVGLFFPALATLTLIYAYFGPYFPGIWTHKGISFQTIIEVIYLSHRGIWGLVTGISATVIAIFVIFGAVLLRTGGGQTFLDFAIWVSGRANGGAAKVATVASSLFGTISGSAAANVATTGTFTIPLMKKLGYRPEFAAGVEATASTGGQLMPPIMGAAAFIMAELLQTKYLNVAIAGLGPALLFYLGVYFAIHFESKRIGYTKVPDDQIPKPGTFLKWSRCLPVVIPLGILFFYLVRGFTPMTCGFWALTSAIALFLLSDLKSIIGRIKTLLNAFESAGNGLVSLAVMIVCAQIILAMIVSTGLGVKFSSLVMSLGEQNLWIALFLAMIICIILGMGLPTSAAYILAAAVVAPALIRLNLSPLVAHFFIFYYAISAGLTPPICPTVFIGASLAEANWVETAWVAFRLGLVAFIAPFMFVKSPSILLIGDPLQIAFNFATAVAGVIALAGGAMGFFFTKVNVLERSLLAFSGLTLFMPGWKSDLLGLAIVSLFVLSYKMGFAILGEKRMPS